MIDAAAQVLLSVNNSKSNADNSPLFKRNDQGSGSSFGDIFSNSNSQSEKKPEDIVARRDQSKQSESRRSESSESTNQRSSNEVNRDSPSPDENNTSKDVKDVNEPASNSPARDNENTTAIAKESGSDNEEVSVDPAEKEASVKQAIEKELRENVSEITDDSLEVDIAELAVDGEVVKAVIDEEALLNALNDQDKGKGLKVGHELQELKNTDSDKPVQKLGQLAQAIVNEFKASKDKVNDLDEPEAVSRLKILSEIEKALVNPDVAEEAITPEKLLKPDFAISTNAAKVLGEQVKAKDLNITSAAEVDPELLVDGEGDEFIEPLETTGDALLEKMIQRLDFSKLKGEENQLSKIANDKSTIAEFVDKLSNKISGESSIGSLISPTTAVAGKAGVLPPPQQLAMNTNINQPQWGTDFSKRIQFMINNDIKHAELRLDPPELGRINIKISMNQDQANVVFSSAHGNVRETIENTLPRLRELLNESGIQLGDANVNEREKGQERQTGSDSSLAGPVFPGFDEESDQQEDNPRAVVQHSVDGVIDYFA